METNQKAVFGLIESAGLSRACREQGRQARGTGVPAEGSCPWGAGDVRRVWWMEGFGLS